jgi:hypothetical protein
MRLMRQCVTWRAYVAAALTEVFTMIADFAAGAELQQQQTAATAAMMVTHCSCTQTLSPTDHY